MDTIFNLEALKAELEAAEWEDDPEAGQHEQQKRTVYLGSVISLCPSGKYYTPWANSNVEPCPVCNGKGTLPNPTADTELYGIFKAVSHDVRARAMNAYGAYCEGKWPDELGSFLDGIESQLRKYHPDVECTTCDGIGSEEAAKDTRWYDQAEAELHTIDAFLESGDSDGCDLYAYQCRDIPVAEVAGSDQ